MILKKNQQLALIFCSIIVATLLILRLLSTNSQPSITDIEDSAIDKVTPDMSSLSQTKVKPALPNDDKNYTVIDLSTDVPSSLPRLLTGLSAVGAELQEYLVTENIGYLETSHYPFTEETDKLIKRYAESGEILLFDNTQAKGYLKGYDKHSGEIVANYYGSGIEAEMIVATSIQLENGGIEYMVLPIPSPKDDNLVDQVKQSIALFKEEIDRKNNIN